MMNLSQPKKNSGASGNEAEAMRLTYTGPKHGLPKDSSVRSSHHSGPYNPRVMSMSLEPPSYNSVAAQDASEFKNRFGSSSSTQNQMPMPMPGGIDTRRLIGFMDPVMMQPKSSHQGTVGNRKYEHTTGKDVMNQYTNMQQPTVYVMKTKGQSNNDDECCRSVCCVECCFSLCACID